MMSEEDYVEIEQYERLSDENDALQSQLAQAQQDYATLVQLVEEWADASVDYVTKDGPDFDNAIRFNRLERAEQALIRWRQERP